jgi:hypothetical protein
VTGKSWYLRGWVRATAAVALLIAVAVAANAGWGVGKGTTSTARASSSGSHAAKKPGAPARSAAELKKDATAQDQQATREDAQDTGGAGAKAVPNGTWVLGSVGTYVVGRGIRPGVYRSAGAIGGTCQWARLKGSGDAPADVIVNRSATGSSTVTIKSTDKFFRTSDCKNWQKIH